MKRSILTAPKTLRQDVRGTTAVIYALCLLPIMLLVGFAIDATRLQMTQRHMQEAVDAAALSGAREFLMQASEAPASRKTLAQASAADFYLIDTKTTMKGLGAPVIDVQVSDIGEVDVSANADLPMVFGGLFGRNSVNITVNGAAQAGDSRKVEVILALDNTTSMFENDRFTKMREASKGFVNEMFDQTPSDDLMAIGVVPWASVVNINSESPKGWSTVAAGGSVPPVYGSGKNPNSAFENRRKYLYDPDTADVGDKVPYTKASMEEDFAPVEWRGCVRSAPNERKTTGSGFVTNKLTDAAVPGMRWYASWLEPELQSWWVPPPGWTPGPGTGGPGTPGPTIPGAQGFLAPEYVNPLATPIAKAGLSVPTSRRLRCTPYSGQSGTKGLRNVYLNETQACARDFKDPFNDTAKACVSDPTEFEYFKDGGKACEWQDEIFPWDEMKPVSGPNMNCPTAMLGLSGDRKQIMDKLDHMYPVQGGTQADIGLMWGLRALSPRNAWVNFFDHTGDQKPKTFNDPTVRKIMILLTDGKNEAPYHYEGYYGCNEGNSRGEAGECWKAKGVSTLNRNALDGLTLDSCEAIREDYGIELYTIAVDITDGDAITLLGNCAADPTRTFNITSTELDETFSTIAARELRLTK